MLKNAAILSAVLLAAASAPAFAQDAAANDASGSDSERVTIRFLQEGEECPKSRDGVEIVVCKTTEDPYRIPSELRKGEGPKNEAWAERVAANAEVGSTGVGSCNTVGPEGQTGCGIKEIDQAYAEEERVSGEIGLAIAEERARRLENLDEDAAAEQARVEQLEAEYNARVNGTTNPQPASDAEVVATQNDK